MITGLIVCFTVFLILFGVLFLVEVCFFDFLACPFSCSCLNFSVDVPVSLRCKRFVMAKRVRFEDLPLDHIRRKAVPVSHV